MRKINKHLKQIALILTGLPVLKAFYSLLSSPTFLALRKVMVWLSILLTVVTVTTQMEPLADINNLLLTSLASLQVIGHFYSEKIYLFLIRFFMKRVDNPQAILDIVDKSLVNEELIFKNTNELHEYLKKNPDKRLLLKEREGQIRAYLNSLTSLNLENNTLVTNNYNPDKPWYDLERYTEEPEEEKKWYQKYAKYLLVGAIFLTIGGLTYYYRDNL